MQNHNQSTNIMNTNKVSQIHAGMPHISEERKVNMEAFVPYVSALPWLNIDILHKLHLNFIKTGDYKQRAITCADILHSPLTRRIDHNTYMMDRELQSSLKNSVKQDEKKLAEFMLAYSRQCTEHINGPMYKRALEIQAHIVLRPESSAAYIIEQLNRNGDFNKNKEAVNYYNDLLENVEGNTQLKLYLKGHQEFVKNGGKKIPEEWKQLERDEKGSDKKNIAIKLPNSIRKDILHAITDREVLAEIERVKANKETELILKNKKLKHIPPEIFELTQLTVLDLFDNDIAEIPPAIANLSNLKKLYLSKNPITHLPNEISRLKDLLFFKLDEGQLTEFPKVLLERSELREISLEKNQIEFIPPEVSRLQSLDIFDVRNNPLLNLAETYHKCTGSKLHNYYEGLQPLPPASLPVISIISIEGNESEKTGEYEYKIEQEAGDIEMILSNSSVALTEKIESLHNPTTIELFEHCYKNQNRINLLHFTADKFLALKNEAGEVKNINPKQFARLIGKLPNCKCFILNGCETLEYGKALKQNGLPLGIAIEDKITDDEALELTHTFYSALRNGKSIEEAYEECSGLFEQKSKY